MKYSFTWKGVSCTTKGIRLQEMPQIIRPEERIEHVTIPGRAGEVTLTEGDDIYNSYIQSIPLIVDSAADVAAAEQWLRGSGYLTLSSQSNRKQMARVINSVEFKKHSRNSSWWEATVQFYCEPLKESTSSSTVDVTSSGTTVNNPGDVISRPLITVAGSGNVTVTIGGNTISITGLVSGWKIDSDLQWVLDGTTPKQGVYTGSFPVFNPGNNTVAWTGSITKLTIDGRWRYL